MISKNGLGMIKKIVYHDYGSPFNVLKLETGPMPGPPGQGEVLVQVIKRPIHNGDLLMIGGGHDPVSQKIPESGYNAGCEGMGTIQAIGPGIDESRGLQIGDRVSFFGLGSWSEELLVQADYVAKVPDDLEDSLAAQILINPIAAMMLIQTVAEIAASPQTGVLRVSAVEPIFENLSNLETGGVVLLSVAGSTVAKLVASVLKERGIVPIGLIRSSAKGPALAEELGIQVIGFDGKYWKEEVVKAAAGRRIFAGLDAVGGKIGEEVLGLLSPAGTLISYGSLTAEPIPVDHVHLCMTKKKICGIGMAHWTQMPFEERIADIPKLVQMVKDHSKFFKVAEEFALEDISDAVRLFRKPGRDGTVILCS
jgi:NADPH:quinone reductase-like Zn-dependent oxidoreductase